MLLNYQQILAHLKQNPVLAPVYLIHGDEILLRQEIRDAIRDQAVATGYSQYQRFDVENHFNWKQLFQTCKNKSLFFEKSLIEVVNSVSKFDSEASKELQAYCQKPPPDKLLLIVSGKLTPAQQKSPWFQAIQKMGVTSIIYPISISDLPRWIRERAATLKLNLEPQSITRLAELTEGNLLATYQSLVKLQLLFSKGERITPDLINQVTPHHTKFNIFELSDYLLKGDINHIPTILNTLQSEGVEPTLVLWQLTRDLRQIISMQIQLQQGKSLQQVVASQWKNKQSLYQMALRRLKLPQTKQFLKFASTIDATIKGQATGNVWQQLLQLCILMAHGGHAVLHYH